jgi:hypothetical protein
MGLTGFSGNSVYRNDAASASFKDPESKFRKYRSACFLGAVFHAISDDSTVLTFSGCGVPFFEKRGSVSSTAPFRRWDGAYRRSDARGWKRVERISRFSY